MGCVLPFFEGFFHKGILIKDLLYFFLLKVECSVYTAKSKGSYCFLDYSVMNDQERQKMCWNCDASVSRDATFCPFCGADLMSHAQHEHDEEGRGDMFSSKSLDESLASLYKPPYSVRDHEGYGVPRNDMRKRRHPYESFPREDEAPLSDEMDDEPLVEKRLGGGWPLILLSIGGQLMTLGLLLFFFSSGGKLTLEWNARYWFLYCIASLPILYFGWRMLSDTSSSLEEFEEL